jgi:hypothetical protein
MRETYLRGIGFDSDDGQHKSYDTSSSIPPTGNFFVICHQASVDVFVIREAGAEESNDIMSVPNCFMVSFGKKIVKQETYAMCVKSGQ